MQLFARSRRIPTRRPAVRGRLPLLLLGSTAGIALVATGLALAVNRFAPDRMRMVRTRLSTAVRRPTASVRVEMSSTPPNGARLVGTTATRVYHSLDDEHLPAERHRVYFTSEEEAETLGYKPAGQPA